MHVDSIARDLAIHGYAIVPAFLSSADAPPALMAYLAAAEKFHDGVINNIPAPEMAGVQRKIRQLIPGVAQALGLAIDPDAYGYSAIRIQQADGPAALRQPFDVHRDPKIAPGGVLNWHLDHFSYYLHRDHTNWLICYMPVAKPSPALANLAIVPYDVLAAHDPQLLARTRGRGAMRFRCVEADTLEWFRLRFPGEALEVGDWFAIDDDDDATMGWKISIDLEQYKVVPQLAEGDLLIMRADVIHRTHDAGSDRISIRCDAVPVRAGRLGTLPGLLGLTLRYPFMGAKRRYNLKKWLAQAWITNRA